MHLLVLVSSWSGFVIVSAPTKAEHQGKHQDNHSAFPSTESNESWRDEPLSHSKKILLLIMWILINILTIEIMWCVSHIWTLTIWTEVIILLLGQSWYFAQVDIGFIFQGGSIIFPWLRLSHDFSFLRKSVSFLNLCFEIGFKLF